VAAERAGRTRLRIVCDYELAAEFSDASQPVWFVLDEPPWFGVPIADMAHAEPRPRVRIPARRRNQRAVKR